VEGEAAAWGREEAAVLDELSSPHLVQEFLSGLDYSTDHFYRSPRSVLRDRKAHCADGAFFAAAALRRLGFPPIILDLKAVRDDDHLLALYRADGHWGAVAKSNTTVLRFREPVFRSVREIVLSYFEFYFNVCGEKTLRSYSLPLRLERFDARGWTTRDDALPEIVARLDASRHIPVLKPAMVSSLSPVSAEVLEAGLLGANHEGLYHPLESRG
jgi:hypothetical protein